MDYLYFSCVRLYLVLMCMINETLSRTIFLNFF
ncbi:hypothetical protein TorRG33x02_262920 [Trema orientale]|uniref:Uncharacterized protein n=1 Tax=Trema orientale TaxID=63057 RepID=A0A2P5D3U8_TREOI|nr:hypothetical protein TorRG33x02_262920 [Trema orientale]